MARIYPPNAHNSECQIFYFFDIFRRTLKIPGENPAMSLYCILKFGGESQGKFPRGHIPRDSTGKYGGNIHIEKFPLIPPEVFLDRTMTPT